LKTSRIVAADLFCGAGGTSTGMGRACRDLGLELDLLAVNHWPIAIETHSRNHPAARHLCESLDGVDPRKHVIGRLNLLVASPECTEHSYAGGSRSVSDQGRASGWHVPRWLEATKADAFIIENVPAWMKWGPVGANGRPIKSRQGETFKALLRAIEALYYSVEFKVLCAADYGDATTRPRLFVLGRKGRKAIEWPEPTHGERTTSLLRELKPWRAAREIIDWSIPSRSIFGRPKPLSRKTLARFAEGLRRFSGGAFTLSQAAGGAPRAVSQPLPTLTTDGAVRVVEPMIVTLRKHATVRSVAEPLTAITGSGNHHVLVEAFIACYYGTDNLHPVSRPLPTITTKDRFALVEPVIIDGQMLDVRSRMLEPHELAAATSLDAYNFAGTKTEIKKQIGNAVPGELARALCRVQLAPFVSGRREERAA
jgi:DNA (cytosine-5)-methyltransferase 1